MKKLAVGASIVALLAVGLAGWSLSRVQSIEQHQAAIGRQVRSLTPAVNGQPRSMAEFVQAFKTVAHEVADLDAQQASVQASLTTADVNTIVTGDLRVTAERLSTLERTTQCLSQALQNMRSGFNGTNC